MGRIKKGLLAASLTALIGVALATGVACGDKNAVSVKFNTDGGEKLSSVELKKGESFELPTPVKEGYSFEGWYTDKDFSGDPVTEMVADKNVTYYAKWEIMYVITVDVAGGTLSCGTLYLKAGENVYDFMQSYVPTKTGYEFGRWRNGNEVLARNTRMPEGGLTLTAEYKVPYTVQIWEQNLTQDGYEMRTVTGFEYAGVEFESEQTVTGFEEIVYEEGDEEGKKTVSKLTISQTAAENVFVHYFDRETFEVTFSANYPNGAQSADVTVEEVYGKEIEIPSDYTFEGYCLIGWATSADGEAVYGSNYIQNAVYGGEDAEAVTVLPERNMVLYAVWLEGYRDMFSNGDYIFLVENETEEGTEYSIYLSRGGILFEGEYYDDDKSFFFTNEKDKTIVKGRINGNGTFIYSDASKAENAYTLFVSGKGLQNTKIYFDEYDGITYSETRVEDFGGEQKEITYESFGSYYINDNGYFVISFTEGELAGQEMTMITGYVQDSSTGAYIRAFQVRNDEEYNMGELVRFDVYQNTLTYWTIYQITLDGFGTAYVKVDEQGNYQTMRYLYDSENSLLTLLDNYGQVSGYAFISEKEVMGATKKGYAFYTEEMDEVYPFEGGKLVLDGMFNATYTDKAGKTVKGYYTSAASALGGTIVSFKGDDGVDYKFIITVVQNEISMGDQTITTVSYIVEQKHTAYAEYFYKDEQAIWYGPVITVNDPEEGKATLYAFTPARTYEKISYGTLVYDETTKLYTYTAEEYFTPEVEVNTSPIDLSTVKTMICALDTSASQYAIHYWYSYTTEEGTVESDAQYTSAKGDKDTLTLVSGIAILKKDGAIIVGQYATDEKTGITQIQTAAGGKLYLKLEGETFTLLDHAPYTSRLLESDGDSISKDVYLSFDGFGGVTYTVVTKGEGEEEDVTTVYVGTREQLKETTVHGLPIYLFKAEATETTEAIEFKYIEIPYSNSYTLFAKYNETYNGVYQSPEYGKLELDGYGYWATYKDVEGNTYESKYFIRNENEITFLQDEVERYFDLKEDGTFTLRGIEYGTYIHSNNQYLNNLYFEMDGYGKLTVFTMVENEEGEYERKDIDVNGTYIRDGYDFTFTYTQDGETKTLYGALGLFGNYLVFIEKMSGVARTYVNGEDLSVLILDDLGNAVKHTKDGVKEYGYYTLITDEILYYVNAAENDACIYHYDVEAGTAIISEYEPRGYYTADLESLIFTEYGFAVFSGQTRYYYDIDEDFNVTIYREAEEGEEHNGYGFVAEDFGEYETTKEYNGKTYYATDGLSIAFKRKNAEKYPIGETQVNSLSFAPMGNGEFTVAGTVNLGDTSKTCYVTRSVDEEGNVELYFTVGGYRFDFTVTYTGDVDGGNNNCYEITRMRNIVTTYAYSYTYMYYLYYYFMGQEAADSYENEIGEIAFVCEYDEAGKEVRSYASATFGKDSKMYNTKGELFTGGEYTVYDEEGNALTLKDIKLSNENKTHTYVLQMESEGYQYKFYFAVGNSVIEGMLAYQTVAFVREETITANDGYTLKAQTVIVSDIGYKAGEFYTLEIVKGEETIKGEAWFEKDGALYYILREKDAESGLITKTTYYKLILVKDEDASLGGGVVGDSEEGGETDGEEVEKPEDEESNIVPIYLSATVTVEEGKTVYAENQKDFLDINVTTGKVMVLAIDGTAWIVMGSEYDAESNTYTVKLSETKSYTVKVLVNEDGEEYVEITEIVVEEEEAA